MPFDNTNLIREIRLNPHRQASIRVAIKKATSLQKQP
jgi:hypothetical protein